MDHALLAFQRDLEKISPKDWLATHTSFTLPPHKFRGEVYLQEDRLLFKGSHKDTHKPHKLSIPLNNIVDIRHGFDELYSRRSDRAVSIHSAPLRITYREDNTQSRIYVWIGFNRLTRMSQNRTWMKTLTKALPHHNR